MKLEDPYRWDCPYHGEMPSPHYADYYWKSLDGRRKARRVRKTLIRLFLSGRLDQLPVFREHRGWGHYDRYVCSPMFPVRKIKPEIPALDADDGIIFFPAFKGNPPLAYDTLYHEGFKWDVFRSEWVLLKPMERTMIWNFTRVWHLIKDSDFDDVRFWQDVCYAKAKYYKKQFADEIRDWQKREISRLARDVPQISGRTMERLYKMVDAGSFRAAKQEIALYQKHPMLAMRCDDPSTAEFSRRQLRALGFVA